MIPICITLKLAKDTEIRHLEGVRSNFSVSEGEYIGSVVMQDTSPVPQLIYSNAKTIVEQAAICL